MMRTVSALEGDVKVGGVVASISISPPASLSWLLGYEWEDWNVKSLWCGVGC
jgi:hypothetical protein